MKVSIWQRIIDALKSKDEAGVLAAVAEGQAEAARTGDEGGDPTHIHVHAGGGEGSEKPYGRFNDDHIQSHMDQNDADHGEFRSRLEALEGHPALKSKSGDARTADEIAAEASAKAEDEARAARTGDEAKIESALKSEAPQGSNVEKAAKATDSAYLEDSFQAVVAGAEVLLPGINVPTFDLDAKPADTLKSIVGLRAKALDAAYLVPTTRAAIDNALGGKPLDASAMTHDEQRTLFNAAVAITKQSNNAAPFRDNQIDTTKSVKAGPLTLAEINKRNSEHWASH